MEDFSERPDFNQHGDPQISGSITDKDSVEAFKAANERVEEQAGKDLPPVSIVNPDLNNKAGLKDAVALNTLTNSEKADSVKFEVANRYLDQNNEKTQTLSSQMANMEAVQGVDKPIPHADYVVDNREVQNTQIRNSDTVTSSQSALSGQMANMEAVPGVDKPGHHGYVRDNRAALSAQEQIADAAMPTESPIFDSNKANYLAKDGAAPIVGNPDETRKLDNAIHQEAIERGYLVDPNNAVNKAETARLDAYVHEMAQGRDPFDAGTNRNTEQALSAPEVMKDANTQQNAQGNKDTSMAPEQAQYSSEKTRHYHGKKHTNPGDDAPPAHQI